MPKQIINTEVTITSKDGTYDVAIEGTDIKVNVETLAEISSKVKEVIEKEFSLKDAKVVISLKA